jgi:hypothetical protein
MAHAHAHAHTEGEGTFFLDQLFTILVAGGIGLVGVLMYQSGTLGRILAPMFFKWVVGAGCVILVMALIRAVAVWKLAGTRRTVVARPDEHAHDNGEACGHEHSHGDDCGHDHGHAASHTHSHSHSHAHSHSHDESQAHDHGGEGEGEDHGHDHGWAPWKYMILAVPIFLYFLGFPRAGIANLEGKFGGSVERGGQRQLVSLLAGGLAMGKTNPTDHAKLSFRTLSDVAARESERDLWDGDTGIVQGQFAPGPGNEFTLFRVDRTCCYADQTYMQVKVVAPEKPSIAPETWVRVHGTITFRKNERGNWVPVFVVDNMNEITPGVDPVVGVNTP